jgi:hypothetical protein
MFMTRKDNGTIEIKHQKSNLGCCREPLTLEWLAGGLPQLVAQVADFSNGGFAVRQQGRADDNSANSLLKIIAEFESRGQFCGSATTSRNHVHAALKSEPAFLKLKLRQDDTKRIVTQCQRAKWIESIEYRSLDRKLHQRWTVTADGLLFAGISAPTAPTAPTAPSTEVGTVCANGTNGSAPTAPTGIGGVGERAHTKDGASEAGHG